MDFTHPFLLLCFFCWTLVLCSHVSLLRSIVIIEYLRCDDVTVVFWVNWVITPSCDQVDDLCVDICPCMRLLTQTNCLRLSRKSTKKEGVDESWVFLARTTRDKLELHPFLSLLDQVFWDFKEPQRIQSVLLIDSKVLVGSTYRLFSAAWTLCVVAHCAWMRWHKDQPGCHHVTTGYCETFLF